MQLPASIKTFIKDALKEVFDIKLSDSFFNVGNFLQNYTGLMSPFNSGLEYTGTIPAETFTAYEKDIVRCIHALDEFQEKGISKRHYKSIKIELSSPVGIAMQKFLSHLQSLRRSKSTISVHRMYLYRLLTYLESKQVQTIEDVKEAHIITLLSTATNKKIGAASCVRMFLSYLFEPVAHLVKGTGGQ